MVRLIAHHRYEGRVLHRVAEGFWNRYERRLRAGIRVCIFFGFWGFGPALLHLFFGEFVRSLAGEAARWLASILLDLLRLVVVLLGAWFVARFVDRRPFAAYGFRLDGYWWRDCFFGLLLGAGLMGAIFFLEWLAGWIVVTDVWVAPPGQSLVAAIAVPLVLAIVVAIAEEVLARGDMLLNFTEGFRPFGRVGAVLAAWMLSSVIFGALHFFNPNSSWLSTLYLVIYGIFLGAGYVLTGQLALPIGLHFAWNFFQGTVFGFPVSGRAFAEASVLATEQLGPVLWTGGAFGPEAGLLGILAALAGISLIALWVRLTAGELGFGRLEGNTFQAISSTEPKLPT